MSGTTAAGSAPGSKRRHGGLVVAAVAVIAVAAVVAVGAVLVQARHEVDQSANGTGLTYEGRWYWASSARVADDALGEVVARGVAFQDRTADLRAVRGFDPSVGLAAYLPSLDGSPGGDRWTWVSTDQPRGTNPSAYPDVRAVLAR